MALPPSTPNTAFLREVDEELHRERLASIWARHGSRIVVGIVAVLALVAAGLWWRSHREAQRGVEGERLQAAFDKLAAGDSKGANAALAPIAADGGPGYRSLARLTQADIRLEARNAAGAASSFGAVAGDEDVAKPFRDLALVRQTAAEFDALKPEVTVQRLRALATPGQPFFSSAGEMVGLAYLRMGKRDLAATLFGQIAAEDAAPPSIRQRAVQMASVLQSGGAPVAPTPATAPAQDQGTLVK